MIEIRCKECNKPLGQVEMIVGEIYCGNTACKAGSQYKILTDDTLISFKFTTPPRPPKKAKEQTDS